MAPILHRAPLGGESDRSVFEIVTLLCRRETDEIKFQEKYFCDVINKSLKRQDQRCRLRGAFLLAAFFFA
jgi:hypothetical protein